MPLSHSRDCSPSVSRSASGSLPRKGVSRTIRASRWYDHVLSHLWRGSAIACVLLARDERGFTLSEMVVTMAIMGVVIGAVATLFTSGSKAAVDLNLRFASQTEARLALDTMQAGGPQRLLRDRVGYVGVGHRPERRCVDALPVGRAQDARLGVCLHGHERQLVHRQLARSTARAGRPAVRIERPAGASTSRAARSSRSRTGIQSAAHRRHRHDRQPEAVVAELQVPDPGRHRAPKRGKRLMATRSCHASSASACGTRPAWRS